MAKDPDNLAGSFDTENTGGLLSGFLAEEEELDRRALWRLGSWGVGAVGAVTVAVMANQSSFGWRRDQIAAVDLTRQAQQIQAIAREGQNETRRLASAIDTLNSDRDRLYIRVTTLEQGLESVTGAIARQSTSASLPAPGSSATAEAPPAQAPAPAVAPVATTQAPPPTPDKSAATDKPGTAEKSATAEKLVTAEKAPAVLAAEPSPPVAPPDNQDATKKPPATRLVASKSMMAPPDPAAAKLLKPNKPASVVTVGPIPEVAAAPPPAGDEQTDEAAAQKAAIQRTEFGVDLGSANSVAGLRALWRGLLKSRSNAQLSALRPIIFVKEGTNGLGMQLRLVAGPLNDAGAAARICAVMAENQRPCETAIFDGQRLSVKTDDTQPPAAAKPAPHHRSSPKRATGVVEEPKKPESTTVSSVFGKKSGQ